jgi:chaperone required for assembly of F1-ATPase
MLAWLEGAHGVRLTVTTSILPTAQPGAARAQLRALVEGLDDWPLVGMHAATTALGSLVLALALSAGRLDAEAALRASLLDEHFEIERWGQDAEIERRHAILRRDIEAAATFLMSARASYITGVSLLVDGGRVKHLL